ncbi:flavodoxin family protein [[Clostridium] innocuum]|uniref:flavodoxin family protein n=1 Tax=Clostridium innocuum TaxID=1522 RepID=UPI0032581AD4
MKVLVLNGSPKKSGQTMLLTKELTARIQGDVEVLHIYDYMPLKPCLGCQKCKIDRVCAQEDYFQLILEKIEAADCIVLASPMWFGNVSGPMLSFLSRMNVVRNGYEVRKDKQHTWKKAGILVLTTGARWKSMAKSVEATVEFYFHEMDALMLGGIYANKTDLLPSVENKYAMLQCGHIANIVNAWARDKAAGDDCSYGYSSWNYMEYDCNRIA